MLWFIHATMTQTVWGRDFRWVARCCCRPQCWALDFLTLDCLTPDFLTEPQRSISADFVNQMIAAERMQDLETVTLASAWLSCQPASLRHQLSASPAAAAKGRASIVATTMTLALAVVADPPRRYSHHCWVLRLAECPGKVFHPRHCPRPRLHPHLGVTLTWASPSP